MDFNKSTNGYTYFHNCMPCFIKEEISVGNKKITKVEMTCRNHIMDLFVGIESLGRDQNYLVSNCAII